MAETFFNQTIAHLRDAMLAAEHRLHLFRDLRDNGGTNSAAKNARALAGIQSHSSCDICAGFEGNNISMMEVKVDLPWVDASDPNSKNVGNDFSNDDLKAEIIRLYPALADVVYNTVDQAESVTYIQCDLVREEIIVQVPDGSVDADTLKAQIATFVGV